MTPHTLPRRLFLKLSTLAMAAAAAVPSALRAQPAPAPDRPNIVFIITDDQRYDAVGVVQREQGAQARVPFFQTPNMDRIAAEGARFRNAFVVHSLCSPSRGTFLTGVYSHAHGVTHNAQPFPDQSTWATSLVQAGYATGYFGKWHMDEQKDRPGFQDIYTFLGQGNYDNCPFLDNGKPAKSEGWVDDVTTDRALKFIERNKSKPFAMVVGYKTPHDPRKPAARHANLYSDVTIAPPVSFGNLPPFAEHNKMKPKASWNGRVADRLNYFRCLAGVDDNVGRILDTLDNAGLRDNTLVVYVGDNGYYLGEHGLGDKRTAYEESIRIPMLVRYPKRIKPGTLVDQTVLNTDFAPTVLELAGLPALPKSHGRSLLRVLSGSPASDWRTSFLYENYQDPAYPDVTFDVLAVRTDDAKLVTYPGHEDWNQLFDLKADPHEIRNLIADPAAADLLKRMRAELEKQKRLTGYPGK